MRQTNLHPLFDKSRTYLRRESRRILMTLFGVLICAFSVGLFSHSHLGVDPFQVFAQSLGARVESWTGLDYGTFYMILNLLLLVGIFFWNRRKIGLGTVMNIFLVGYIATASENLMKILFPGTTPIPGSPDILIPSLPVRIALLTVGVVVMCFGSAFYFVGDLGVSTYDAVALTLAERTRQRYFKYIRITTDLICVGAGWLIGGKEGIIGVGTIITAFFMGPLISFFRRTAAEPFLRAGRGAGQK